MIQINGQSSQNSISFDVFFFELKERRFDFGFNRPVQFFLIAPLSGRDIWVELRQAGKKNLTSVMLAEDRFVLLQNLADVRVSSMSQDAKICFLLFGNELSSLCSEEFKLKLDLLKIMGEEVEVVAQSRWIFELMQRAVFETRVCHGASLKTLQFCAIELLKEVYYRTVGKHEALPENHVPDLIEDPGILRAVSWVDQNLEAEIRIEQLCRIAHMSESSFIRKLRREIGLSPLQFIKERRMQKAKHLLRHTSKTISEISDSVGYQDTSSFQKAFKKETGLAPNAYRKALTEIKDSDVALNESPGFELDIV